ncbi:rab-GTPase-TBC domain-containing protein [Parasitella parasitica]|nr:rab-GTPase-TBC domain-containing protein [Parasitella parasitica]
MTCKSEELLDDLVRLKGTVGGLGLQYGYHSDVTEVKDHKKLNIWKNYFNENGRNLTMVRLPIFTKMIRIGIPNCLRGEVYEMCSGSIYLRFANQGIYDQILETHKDDQSPALYDIEKDLHRSLPEYSAYQSPDGIDRLRRVLTAYSWKNPEIGYCQAMNIVASSLLIYMTEEQAFWTLNSLVDQLCPGYYSSSMYGILLDQVVLEELVKEYIPKITEHFQKKEIQLSVACLPWFLTLFINSMPLPFAFRILDCFFMEGPKVLFQIALSILKRNEVELVKIEDDSELLVVVKTFFASLNLPVDDATKEQDNANKLEIFNSLMKSAYSDFPSVISYKVNQLRKQNELKIIGGVESFTKRNALRNVKNNANFGPEEISLIYDYFFGALYYAKNHQDKSSVPEMDMTAFRRMMVAMTTWANLNDNSSAATNNEDLTVVKQVLEAFIQRLFTYFRHDTKAGVTLQDTISKLGEILRGDIMSKTAFYFALYDEDEDGELDNADLHTMSTELFLLMNLLEPEFDQWDTVCSFITLIDKLHEDLRAEPDEEKQNDRSSIQPLNCKYFVDHINKIHNVLINPQAPTIKITLPSLRMVILTEDRLDRLIQTDIPQSFKLQRALVERQKGLGHEIFEALFVEGKKLANNMAASNTHAKTAADPSPSVSSERRSLSGLSSPAIPARSPSGRSTTLKSSKSSVADGNSEEEEFELV